MERVEANRRLRCLFPDDRVDPLRAIGRDMRQQSRSGRPEGVEEQCQGVFAAALVGPHEATGVMVDHTREVSVSLPVVMWVIGVKSFGRGVSRISLRLLGRRVKGGSGGFVVEAVEESVEYFLPPDLSFGCGVVALAL